MSCFGICGGGKKKKAREEAIGHANVQLEVQGEQPRRNVPARPASEHTDFTGVWDLSNSINFDAYLEAIGVSYMKRKMAAGIKPRQTWRVRSDGTLEFEVKTPIGTKVESFPIGQPIRDTVDGEELVKTSHWENGTLVTKVVHSNAQKAASMPETTMRRYLRGTGADQKLILEMRSGQVLTEREFTRIDRPPPARAKTVKSLPVALPVDPSRVEGTIRPVAEGAPDFRGRWQLVASTNFDEYLSAMGVGYMKRSVAAGMRPIQEWELKGDTWQFVAITAMGNRTERLPIGQMVLDEIDGEAVEKVSRWTGPVLHTQLRPRSAKAMALGEMSMRRYLSQAQGQPRLILEMRCGSIVCLREFGRVLVDGRPAPALPSSGAEPSEAERTPAPPAAGGRPDFSGSWQLSGSRNFDEYLTAMGVGYVKRSLAASMRPVQEWELRGETWQFSMATPLGPKLEKFPIGQAVADEVDGEALRKTSGWDANVLHTEVALVAPKPGSALAGKTMSMRRYVTDAGTAGEKLILEMRVGKIVAFREFSRLR